jgi:hypothetical protein
MTALPDGIRAIISGRNSGGSIRRFPGYRWISAEADHLLLGVPEQGKIEPSEELDNSQVGWLAACDNMPNRKLPLTNIRVLDFTDMDRTIRDFAAGPYGRQVIR